MLFEETPKMSLQKNKQNDHFRRKVAYAELNKDIKFFSLFKQLSNSDSSSTSTLDITAVIKILA